jgi:hypothetical protein
MIHALASPSTSSPHERRLIRTVGIATLVVDVAIIAVVIGTMRQVRPGIYAWVALVVFDFLILLPAGVFIGARTDTRRAAEGWRPPSKRT